MTAFGRLRPLITLELATILSGTGNAVVAIALPWLILERTGSAAAAGLVGGATALPMLISAVFSGTLIDRIGRKRMAVISDVLSGLTLAAIPLLDLIGGLNVGTLALLAVAGAVFDPAGLSARETMLPAAARHANLPLDRANGIHEAVWGFAFLLGPGLGGLMIALVGSAATMWVAAAGFGLAALLLLTLRLAAADAPQHADAGESVWAATLAGIRFVWRDRLLRSMAILMTVLVGLYLPIEAVVLPVYFQAQDAPERLGVIVMVMSGGAVLGALLYAALGAGRRRAAVFRAAMLVTSVLLLAMASLPAFGAMVALSIAIGVAFGPANPIANLAMQERTPEAFRGRVVGLITSLGFAAGPAGYLIAGPLVELVGVRTAFAALAGLLTLAGIISCFMPSLNDLDGLHGQHSNGAKPAPAPLAPQDA